jgi:hypothetical protein
MTRKPPKDAAASVRQRLLNLSRRSGEDFQRLLTRYAAERLLDRLSRSEHAPPFVLKGALLFALWTGEPHRPTRDPKLILAQQEIDAELCPMRNPDLPAALIFLGDDGAACAHQPV